MSRNGIDHRHCKWPLGTAVMVKTPQGYLQGKVNRHQNDRRYRNGCDVCFEVVVNMGDANGTRYCHHVPFRSMRRVDPTAPRLTRPWYKETTK